MTFQFNKTIITILLINNVEARATVRTNIFLKYVLKHKSAKLFMTYAVGKLEASLNISHLILSTSCQRVSTLELVRWSYYVRVSTLELVC